MRTTAERAEKILSSWSVLYEARKKFLTQYHTIWDIPVRNRHTDVLLEELAADARVLEIGSSDRQIQRLLAASLPGAAYKSMDIDRETLHDYYSLDDVGETFDAVLAFEVIEHMLLSDGVRLLARAYDLLSPGGKVIMTTPNVAHPTHFFRDPTHVTPYSHEGLGGVLLGLGYEVTHCWRIYDAPVVTKLMRKYVTAPIQKYLGVDFAHTLAVVARRPDERTGR